MRFPLFKKINQFIITLRASLLFIFISLFVTIIFLILLVTTVRYTKILNYVAYDLMEYASTSLVEEFNNTIAPIQARGQLIADLIEKNLLKSDESTLLPVTYYLVAELPYVVRAYWGDNHGNFIFSKQSKDKSIVDSEVYNRNQIPPTRTLIYRSSEGNIIKTEASSDLSYDPRLRPWYLLAQKNKKSSWTDTYFFHHNQEIGIASSTPVYRQGTLYGVFGLVVNLNYLNHLITKKQISEHGFSFIITKKGELIAYPKTTLFSHLNPSNTNTDHLSIKSIPLIEKSLAHYNQSGQKRLIFPYQYLNETYMISYELISSFKDYGWVVGVVVPKSDFTVKLRRLNEITITLCGIILILGIYLVSVFTTHIVKPIKLLAQDTEEIKRFNLDHETPISSNIKEIIFLKNAMNSMKIGLKLFQKYIPRVLVKQLIESGEDLRVGGTRKELTVFFSDIVNFTSITEKISPNELINKMGQYFEELTQIIIDEQGTIDKYIGDSIMAFWGAPLMVEGACGRAARAALRCQKKVDALNELWKTQGNICFNTRIGIHTGEAIIGNLGSSERSSYTAIGDTINIASRLENSNKLYQTKIIVSDKVYQQIKDCFALRMIDLIVVKGRTQSSLIYELLGDEQTPLPFNLQAYNIAFKQGFLFYQKQQWSKASAFFKECVDIYPKDTVAPIFVARCCHFETTPPPKDWDGAWKN